MNKTRKNNNKILNFKIVLCVIKTLSKYLIILNMYTINNVE